MKLLLVTVFLSFFFLLIGFVVSQRFFVGDPIISAYSITWVVFVSSFLLTFQSLFTLVWMLYAWEDPEGLANRKSPKTFSHPRVSFTALVPARHEEHVIADTIMALNNISYPENLKETIILCREDDVATIAKAKQVIEELQLKNVRVETFGGYPINKPYALNIGLKLSKNEIVCVFDAEDEPHSDIYNIINTVFMHEHVDVIQSGVQLMNFRSRWFSALNCLEYFFWFKSGLHFFSHVGQVTPLGGNTVFFKKGYLEKVNGWDAKCLTEDADIGFRLAEAGAKIRVIYDETHTTKEESPSTIKEFIKQRTRWNQGFLQILVKPNWSRVPKLRQKTTALYILLSPVLQAFMFIYTPLAIIIAFTIKMPVVVSLFSFIPLLLLGLQITTQIIGLYEFTKAYRLPYPWYMPIKIIITYFPYQFLLMLSSLRALFRFMFSVNGWEKTAHLNAHRES